MWVGISCWGSTASTRTTSVTPFKFGTSRLQRSQPVIVRWLGANVVFAMNQLSSSDPAGSSVMESRMNSPRPCLPYRTRDGPIYPQRHLGACEKSYTTGNHPSRTLRTRQRHTPSGHNHARTMSTTACRRSSEMRSRYVAAMLVSTWPMMALTATWSFESPAMASKVCRRA